VDHTRQLFKDSRFRALHGGFRLAVARGAFADLQAVDYLPLDHVCQHAGGLAVAGLAETGIPKTEKRRRLFPRTHDRN
jgi:hypothetical protein